MRRSIIALAGLALALADCSELKKDRGMLGMPGGARDCPVGGSMPAQACQRALQSGDLKGILDVNSEPLVSSDYIGSLLSSVVDTMSTNVIDGTLVHISSWYDNEMGYSARCVDLLSYLGATK